MINKTGKCDCGKQKKPWFSKCYECLQKDKQKPKCRICSANIPENHTLCKAHWIEQQEDKKKIKQVEYVKKKKEKTYDEKYKGKYRFNKIDFKSKSELIIFLFLNGNGRTPLYEETLYLDKDYRPDFVIHDDENNTLIIEHFGMNEEKYKTKMMHKIEEYNRLCKERERFYFVYTVEEDIFNLKEALGKKLKNTPFSKTLWK